MRARKKWLIVAAGAAAVVIGLRLALPVMVKSYVNAQFAEMGEYSGRVANIDIALVRGAYTLRDLIIVKSGAEVGTPFLELGEMDISVQWRALFGGELVGEIVAYAPTLNLIQAETDQDTQLGTGVNWPDQVRELFPFRFNRVEVIDGLVMFRAPGIESAESLALGEAHLVLHNLTNVLEEDGGALSELEFTGSFMGHAPVTVTGHINPNEALPKFDIDLALENARLVDVNPWLEEFLRVDAEQGVFSMWAELASAEGRFEGYVKPILEDAKFFELGEEGDGDGPFRQAWEALVHFAANVLENEAEQQVATQIPLSGELKNPDAGTLAAIVSVLRNAFVAALPRSLEGTVTLRNVDPDANIDPAEDAVADIEPD